MNPLKYFKVRKPKQDELLQYIGKKIHTMEGETVTIETIVRSNPFPTRFEINHKYFVVILDFYRQMIKNTGITDDQVKAFDEMEHYVEKIERPTKDVLTYKKEPKDGETKEAT